MTGIFVYLCCTLLTWASLTSGQSYECPSSWVDGGLNCYKFFYELPRNYLGAKDQCKDIGAALVSVENDVENNFITIWLSANDKQNLEWYTSGERNPADANSYLWTATGETIKTLMFWSDDKNALKPGDHIVYSKAGVQWGWDLIDNPTAERAFICEVAKREVTKVVVRERDWTFGQTDLSNIDKGPKFVKQPPREVIFTSAPGNKVAFECLASGNPQPSYEWLVTAGGQTKMINTTTDHYTLTNGKLVIHNPSTSADNSDVGSYQCKAKNKYGTVLGDAVELGFGYIGEFSKTAPKPLEKSMNEDAAIPCNAPPHYPKSINYRWFKGNPTNFVRPDLKPYMFISKNGKLYFSRVKNEDEGLYYCSVSSSAISSGVGQTSVPTRLSVRTGASDTRAPRIHSDFLEVFPTNPMKNDNVTIECFAAGTGNLVYSWRRLPVGSSLPPTATISDHNRVLKIQNIRLEDAGTYECTVSMGQGTTMSKSIPLSLQSIPYFTKELRDHHVDQGVTFQLHCEADGKPRVSYSWYKNGKIFRLEDLPPSDQQRIVFDNTRVTVKDASKADDGMYQCAAKNLHGTTFSASQVRVLSFAPSFAKFPLDPIKYAALDGNVTLVCSPEGAPEPVKKWFKDGSQLSLSTDANSRLFMLNNGNLMIKTVIAADEGTYTCKVTNKHGKAESSGRVIVLSKTVIRIKPMNQLARVNSSFSLDCEASVHPSLDFTYLWLFNGYALDLDFNGDRRLRQYRNLEHYSRGTGSRWGDLVISDVTYAQGGLYTCVALTPQDSARFSANITVIGPPGQPAEVHAIPTSVTANSLTLRWAEANRNGNPVVSYQIEGMSNHRPYWHTYKNLLGKLIHNLAGIRETSLSNLDAWSTYKFRVVAINDYGPGEPSAPSADYTTAQTRPMTAPRNIRQGVGKEGTLVMVWDGLLSAEINGPGMGYKLEWRSANSPETDKATDVELLGNVTEHTVLVGTVNYFRPYMVRVSAFNTPSVGSKRYGDPSNWTEVHSADRMPPNAPENIRARGVNSSCIEVTWTPVANTRIGAGGRILGYRINYWRRGETEAKSYRRQTVIGQTDRGRIIGLEPNTYYEFNVMIFNSAGNGPRSSEYSERTWRKAPQDPPRELRIYRTSDTTLYLTWRGVGSRKDEEPVEGYHIRNWPVGEAMVNVEPVNVGKVTSYTLKGLEPETRYYLRLYAYSRGGHGKMSSPMIQYQIGPGPFLRMMPLPPCNAFPGYTCSAPGLVPSLAVVLVVALLARLYNAF